MHAYPAQKRNFSLGVIIIHFIKIGFHADTNTIIIVLIKLKNTVVIFKIPKNDVLLEQNGNLHAYPAQKKKLMETITHLIKVVNRATTLLLSLWNQFKPIGHSFWESFYNSGKS